MKMKIIALAIAMTSINALAQVVLIPQEQRSSYRQGLLLALESQKTQFECVKREADNSGNLSDLKPYHYDGRSTIAGIFWYIDQPTIVHSNNLVFERSLYKSINREGQPVLKFIQRDLIGGYEREIAEYEFVSSQDDREIVRVNIIKQSRFTVNAGDIRNPNIQSILKVSSQTVCSEKRNTTPPAYQANPYSGGSSRGPKFQDPSHNTGGNG